jgi:hypothetical protein
VCVCVCYACMCIYALGVYSLVFVYETVRSRRHVVRCVRAEGMHVYVRGCAWVCVGVRGMPTEYGCVLMSTKHARTHTHVLIRYYSVADEKNEDSARSQDSQGDLWDQLSEARANGRSFGSLNLTHTHTHTHTHTLVYKLAHTPARTAHTCTHAHTYARHLFARPRVRTCTHK